MEESKFRIAQVVGKMNSGGVESVVLNYYKNIDREKVQFDFIVDEDLVLFYQYDDDLNKVMVNKKETFEDQCKAGKRPRFSLLKVIKQQEKLPILSYKFGVDK